MRYPEHKPTGMERLMAQWPAFAGFACVAAGLGYIWYVKHTPPHILYLRPAAAIIGVGVVLIMFWAFSSDR